MSPGVDSGDSPAGGAGGTGFSTVDTRCYVPSPPPVENPTPEAEERDALARELCIKFGAERGCWKHSSFVYESARDCSADEQLRACSLDVALEYAARVTLDCHGAWVAAVQCALSTTYTPETCQYSKPYAGPVSPDDPCRDEMEALFSCDQLHPAGPYAEGSSATCYPGAGIYSPCEFFCLVGEHRFEMQCYGPDGLPVRCSCTADGVSVFVGDAVFFTSTAPIYADDCQDAAEKAADGVCTARLDCCLEVDEQCGCGDPIAEGYESCEEAADGKGGTIVDTCPAPVF